MRPKRRFSKYLVAPMPTKPGIESAMR
nr:TPA_asm: m23.1 dORF [Murid betaherpesvirus 1]DBA07743.1 TPA_asm: m23.1 dORF [Murid betaherpesvirus 1]